jgi:flavin-dependent dehydrogenase
VGPVLGKIEMPNVHRGPTVPGMALVGDAALATDPLWGVGCGWAFQSAEWLADSVVPALQGDEPIEAGLRSYSKRFAKGLRSHARAIDAYATGRRFDAVERALFASAVEDEDVALSLEAFATRNITREQLFTPSFLRGMARAGTRRLVRRVRSGRAPARLGATA